MTDRLERHSVQQLADALCQEDILDAQRMPLIDKLLAGPRLFERSCWLMGIGLRNQFPSASDEQIHSMIEEQLERLRRLEATS